MVVATPVGWSNSRWPLSASAGVRQSSVLRGLVLMGHGGDRVDLLGAVRGQVGALREVLRAAGRWTLLCLSSGVGEAVERGGWAGGGLDAAVEPSGEGAFEAAADVSVRLALGGAFGFVGAGFVVAAQSGDRDRVQGAVEVSVAGAAESVAGALAAAGLERSDAGQGGECGFAADPAAVGPADQQLGGDDGADAGLGEQRRSGRVLR